MRRPLQMSVALVAAGALACPAAALAGPVRVGETQGLGLLGPEVPAILKQAKTEPYAVPVSCETVNAELTALDEALGPDADEAQPKGNRAAKLVTKAIRGLIPHRDIVRFVTGAGRKENALQQAAMAGWARRGFLKGLSRQMSCNGEPGQIQASAPVEPVAPAAEAAAIPVADTVQEAPLPPAAEPAPEPVEPVPEPVEPLAAPGPLETVAAVEPDAAAVNP